MTFLSTQRRKMALSKSWAYPSGQRLSTGKSIQIIALFVALMCLVLFLRAVTCDFVNMDDPQYVYENEAIRNLDFRLLSWAFSAPAIDLWVPLTWISFALDYNFWQLNPAGYHLTNILLHALNAALVTWLTYLMTRHSYRGDEQRPLLVALMAGLLWGLHPLRVESVVWITERKDVLNGLFSIGSICCYVKHSTILAPATGQVSSENNIFREKWYLLSLVMLAISLLAKPISVVLPVVMIALDYYPLRRHVNHSLSRLLQEKLPFLGLSLLFSATTIYFFTMKPILASESSITLWQRLIVSGHAITRYCYLQIFPVGIIPIHIIPDPIPLVFYLFATMTLIITFVAISMRKKCPAFTTGWIAFIILLIPVLAFLQNGIQAYAARYTYLASIPLCILLAVAVVHSAGNTRRKSAVCLGIVIIILALYASTSWRLIAIWKNSETLWTRQVAIQPYDMAYFYRARARDKSGEYPEALEDYSKSIMIGEKSGRPGLDNLYGYRADLLIRMKKFGEAAQDFTRAINIVKSPHYYRGRAIALKALGDDVQAKYDLLMAEKLADQAD